MKVRPAWRLLAMMTLAVVVSVALVTKLASVQLVEPDRYIEWGEQQRIRGYEIAAHRGSILDRSGIPLALSHPQTTIWADPRVVDDPRATAAAITSVLDLDMEQLEARLGSDAHFTYVARQQPDAVAEAIVALELPGIYTYSEHSRFNPSGDRLARAVLGRAGLDQEGISGLEEQYSDELIGSAGRINAERANDGSTIPGGVYEYVSPVPGSTLTLTIDRALQFETERQLIRHTVERNADGGTAVIADPRNGEILAMASVVRTEEGAVVPASSNMAVTWVFEPGSLFKPVTIAGLVDSGKVSPDRWFELPPELWMYDHAFTDEHRVGDSLQLKHILANSSNIGTIMAARIGSRELLHDTILDFGFGEKSALDFPGESPGIVPDVEDWNGLSLPTMAIGQGIATTAVQILDAYVTLANDGVRQDLQLVKSVTPEGSEPQEADAGEGDEMDADEAEARRVVSSQTAHELTEMLTEVVQTDYGTGALAKIPGYTTAGKTGTAWQVMEDGTYGAPGVRHYVTNFAGFAPAEDPALVAFVALDDPGRMPDGTEPSASLVAAPLFADIMQFALRHQHIPPVATEKALIPIEDERVRAAPAEGAIATQGMDEAPPPDSDDPAELAASEGV